MKAIAWTAMQMHICPSRGVKTLRETRSAVGRFLQSSGYGPAQLTRREIVSRIQKDEVLDDDLLKTAIGKMRARSMKRNYPEHGQLRRRRQVESLDAYLEVS
jgi:hypothetical protein